MTDETYGPKRDLANSEQARLDKAFGDLAARVRGEIRGTIGKLRADLAAAEQSLSDIARAAGLCSWIDSPSSRAALVENVGYLRNDSRALQAESARTNERDGVIAFLVGVLLRIDSAQSLEAARAIATVGRLRIAAWRGGSWNPNPGDDPATRPEPVEAERAQYKEAGFSQARAAALVKAQVTIQALRTAHDEAVNDRDAARIERDEARNALQAESARANDLREKMTSARIIERGGDLWWTDGVRSIQLTKGDWRPIDAQPCDGVSSQTWITVDRAMFDGIVRAAQSLEQHPERCDGKGNLWDDNMREALAMARKLGYAPKRFPGPFALSSELWTFKDDGPSAAGPSASHPAGVDSGIAIEENLFGPPAGKVENATPKPFGLPTGKSASFEAALSAPEGPTGLLSSAARAPAGLDSPVAFDATEPVSPARLGGEILRLALDRARAGDVSSVCEIVHAYEILTGPRP